MSKVPSSVFNMPMHSVIKYSITTTKLRVVFDASAKSSTGISLNDTLPDGPTIYSSLTDILIRFRSFIIAVSSDISKIYRAVELSPLDRDLHRFVCLEKGGILLRKWRSKCTDVLNSIPQELKESTAVQPIVQEDAYHKTLGIDWDSDNDVFHVSILQETAPLISTKRGLVSDIARTYDVLGWFASSVVVMKILLQQLWEANLDWDEEVTQDIQFKHLAWREQIPLFRAKAIPRYYFADSDAIDIELHGFSDASESA